MSNEVPYLPMSTFDLILAMIYKQELSTLISQQLETKKGSVSITREESRYLEEPVVLRYVKFLFGSKRSR